MAWSLNHLPIRESEIVDGYLQAVGKALYLATEFEHKCRYLLRIMKIVHEHDTNPDWDGVAAFACSIKDKLLGPTLDEIRHFESEEAAFAILERGKIARNFIAHEAAGLGHLSGVRPEIIHRSATALRDHLELLIAADNLVSKWLYEIEEREPAPAVIQREYSQWVRDWIFASLHEF